MRPAELPDSLWRPQQVTLLSQACVPFCVKEEPDRPSKKPLLVRVAQHWEAGAGGSEETSIETCLGSPASTPPGFRGHGKAADAPAMVSELHVWGGLPGAGGGRNQGTASGRSLLCSLWSLSWQPPGGNSLEGPGAGRPVRRPRGTCRKVQRSELSPGAVSQGLGCERGRG